MALIVHNIIKNYGVEIVGKQTFYRAKKTFCLLLSILFIISVAATAVSAVTDISKFGPVSKQNYQKGYTEGEKAGSRTGYNEGMVVGDYHCQAGKSKNDNMTSSLDAKSNSAYDLGYADGYNDGYPMGYHNGYIKAYDNCVKSGNQNKQFT